MKDWMNKPMTWGSYWKLAGICSVIGLAITGVSYAVLFKDEIMRWVKNIGKKHYVSNKTEIEAK